MATIELHVQIESLLFVKHKPIGGDVDSPYVNISPVKKKIDQ